MLRLPNGKRGGTIAPDTGQESLMWFAVAIIGMIGIATGITLLPGGTPAKAPPAAVAVSPPPPPASGTAQH
jgi:hypothetical protein